MKKETTIACLSEIESEAAVGLLIRGYASLRAWLTHLSKHVAAGEVILSVPSESCSGNGSQRRRSLLATVGALVQLALKMSLLEWCTFDSVRSAGDADFSSQGRAISCLD
jgi:hypothetical protein